ncbi:hypothetical protein F5B21DRAFT_525534 [Xylaria acuta]|nr:hypothetical protein F5B21DRAFT_525534 [Xylaria acuta]
MLFISGFTFQDEPISDVVKTVLLESSSGDGEIPTDDKVTRNLWRLLRTAVLHLKLWKDGKDTGPFLEAISQQLHIAPLVVLEVLNFAVDARMRFSEQSIRSYGIGSPEGRHTCLIYCADKISCKAMCMKNGTMSPEDWLKDFHKIPAPAPAPAPAPTPAANNINNNNNNGAASGRKHDAETHDERGKQTQMSQVEVVTTSTTTTTAAAAAAAEGDVTKTEQERRLEAVRRTMFHHRPMPSREKNRSS